MTEKLEVYPVILPVDGGFYSYGSIMLDNRGPYLWLNRSEACNDYFHKSQHLYLISDQKIKLFDWAISDGVVVKYNGLHWYEIGDKKIEATTDPSLGLPLIPQSFIEKYVKKQGKIDKVKIAYNNNRSINNRNGLVLTENKEVIILPIKDSWNREEVKAVLHARDRWLAEKLKSDRYYPANEWFDKNY